MKRFIIYMVYKTPSIISCVFFVWLINNSNSLILKILSLLLFITLSIIFQNIYEKNIKKINEKIAVYKHGSPGPTTYVSNNINEEANNDN